MPSEPTLLQALAAPTMYGADGPVELHETHASWVFLAGGNAYKVKKPVRLPFLDYSTLERRHAACREEVRVNGELAPDIYLGVRAIVRMRGGFRFAADDTPDAVEYAVQMRRFDETHTLQGAIRARSLTRAQLREVASRLADFHRRSPTVTGGRPAQVLAAWHANVEELARLEHPGDWRIEAMHGFGEALVNARAEEIERRVREGHVRDGHGDLRCEHVLLGSPIRVVDRIEFDPKLRHLDVACDLAFLAMDLEAHRRRWAMRELVRAYRHAGGNPGSEQLHSFYAAYWALVRAKVALIAATTRTSQDRRRELAQARRLWKLAVRLCWRARQPLVIVVCGVAGSGKSTLAGELARCSGLPVVSSDEIRKRRAGLRATERARPEHYTREFTRGTYDLLGRDALVQLARNSGVIVDATCQTKSQRASLFHRLDLPSVTFLVIHCQVTLETALARAAARMQSPDRISDATPQIVTVQFRRFRGLDELMPDSVLALNAEQDTAVQVAEVTHAVDERIRCDGRAHTGAAETPCLPQPVGCVVRAISRNG